MNPAKKPRREIFECPNCGADVPIGSKACRECGSDEGTGWQSSEEVDYQSLELPDDDGPMTRTERVQGSRWLSVVVVVMVATLVAWLVLR